jgi:hypothetical protein
MRYQSSAGTLGEDVPVGAVFPPSDTVTVVVKNMATGATVTIGSGATTEITINSTSSLYTWNTTQITTQPTTLTHYAVIFTNAAGAIAIQKIVKGGYPDQVAQAALDAVYVDASSGNSGTAYPLGSKLMPVDNMTDAKAIADANGVKTFNLTGSLSLTADDYSGYRFVGNDPLNEVLTVTPATDLTGATFLLIQITGTITMGDVFGQNCLLNAVNGFSGVFIESTFIGTNVLKASVLFGTSILRNCFSALDNLLGAPIFSFNSLGVALQLQGFDGEFQVRNMTHASARFEANMNSGLIVLHSSNTNGQATIRGDTQITDNSAGTTVIDNSTHALVLESTEHQTVVGSLGYDAASIPAIPSKTAAKVFPFL